MDEKLIPLSVKSYCGYKEDERPVSFTIKGKTVFVREILNRKLSESQGAKRERRRSFKIKGDDGKTYVLIHVLNSSEWFLSSTKD